MKKFSIQTLLTTAAVLSTLTACGQTQMPVSASLPLNLPAVSTQANIPMAARPSLLVKFKPGVSSKAINEFHAKYGTHTLNVLPNINVHVIALDQAVGLQSAQLLSYVQRDLLVEYAELNGTMQLTQQTAVTPDYSKMVGQQVTITGTYTTSRSGAIVQTPQGALSIVDNQNRPLVQMPQMAPGRAIRIIGVITPVNGFNMTQNLGVLPMQIKAL